jgi:hypothetical protein
MTSGTSATSKIISASNFGVTGGHIPTLGVASTNGVAAARVIGRVGDTPNLALPPPKVESPATISVMTSDKRNYSKKMMDSMDFSIPPPGLPGLVPPGPPPAFDAPPPTFEAPPPTLVPPGIPPPALGEFVGDDPFGCNYEGYEPTQEVQWSLPPPAESFHPPAGDVPPGDPTYEDRDRDVWGRGRTSRDKSPTPRTYDRRQDFGERDRQRRRRSRSRSRERSRERYDRYRDRDREKRDRERRRSRSRSPRSPSGSDRHKHKKSKKEKRDDRRDKVEVKKEKDDE